MGKNKAYALTLPRIRYIHIVFRFNPRSRCNNSSRCRYRAREHVDPAYFRYSEIRGASGQSSPLPECQRALLPPPQYSVYSYGICLNFCRLKSSAFSCRLSTTYTTLVASNCAYTRHIDACCIHSLHTRYLVTQGTAVMSQQSVK